MALPCDLGYLLCFGARKPARRVEQVLHDYGLFLDWNHDLPSLRCGICDREVDPVASGEERLHVHGFVHQLPILLDHRVSWIHLRHVVPCIVSLPGPVAHVHLRKYCAPGHDDLSDTVQFIQYLLLTPTYINVLNIYAFCNTHDITWGTKGDDKAEKLPSANLKPGGKVDVNIPQDDGDLNAQYEAELAKFATKPPKEENNVSEEDRQADYYKGFRSAVVLVWVFCNFALAAVVLSAAGLEEFSTDNDSTENKRATIYMAVVLWSVAGLSLFKFMGAMWFLTVRMVSRSYCAKCALLTGNIVPRRLIY